MGGRPPRSRSGPVDCPVRYPWWRSSTRHWLGAAGRWWSSWAWDPAALREPERHVGRSTHLAPGFTFWRERLQFLVWANTYDAREGGPVWWHGRKAARRWPAHGVAEGGPADLTRAGRHVRGTWTAARRTRPVPADGAGGGPPVDAPRPGGCGPPATGRPDAELAPDQLAAVAHPAGPGPGDRPGRLGQDPGADRAPPPPGGRPRGPPGQRHRPGLQHPGGRRAARALRATSLGPDGPAHPHAQQPRPVDLQRAGRRRAGCGWSRSRGPGPGRRLFEIRRQANTDTVAPYLDALSAVRLGLVPPDAVEAAMPRRRRLADGFDRYRAALAEPGAVDFDEQIYRAIEILLADPAARVAGPGPVPGLLVDEFQDLTPAHLLLLRLLAAPGLRLLRGGRRRPGHLRLLGGHPRFLIDFGRYFPGAGHHALEVNYRCPPAVVDAARHLLSYNRRRVAKTIGPPRAARRPMPGAAASRCRARSWSRRPRPTRWPVWPSRLGAWRDAGSTRRHRGPGPGELGPPPGPGGLREAGVPVQTPLGRRCCGRTGIRTALAYLRIGADPADPPEDVRDTIRRPSRGIAPMVVDMLTKGRPPRSPTSVAWPGGCPGATCPNWRPTPTTSTRWSRRAARSTAAALRAVRVEIGLGEHHGRPRRLAAEADRSTHADDLLALESVAALHPDAATFGRWLGGSSTGRPADGPACVLSTVHRIKGQEWDRVVVFGASAGPVPPPAERRRGG